MHRLWGFARILLAILFGPLWFPLALTLHRRVLARLALEPGMRVADIGCGPGKLTVLMAQQVGPTGEVCALDIRSTRLRRAQERVRAAGLKNVRFVLAGAGEGKLQPNYFDRAVLVTVLGEIREESRGAALAEIFQALKPGGILSVTEVLPDPHYQSRGVVRRMAHTAGFVEQSCFGSMSAFTMHLAKPAHV